MPEASFLAHKRHSWGRNDKTLIMSRILRGVVSVRVEQCAWREQTYTRSQLGNESMTSMKERMKRKIMQLGHLVKRLRRRSTETAEVLRMLPV